MVSPSPLRSRSSSGTRNATQSPAAQGLPLACRWVLNSAEGREADSCAGRGEAGGARRQKAAAVRSRVRFMIRPPRLFAAGALVDSAAGDALAAAVAAISGQLPAWCVGIPAIYPKPEDTPV